MLNSNVVTKIYIGQHCILYILWAHLNLKPQKAFFFLSSSTQ